MRHLTNTSLGISLAKLGFLVIFMALMPMIGQAQFMPSKDSLTIIVTDGTDLGKKSALQPEDAGNTDFRDPIRPLGMANAIQAGAFLIRPQYGQAGFFLIFCVNDSIGDLQGTLFMNGKEYKGVYRLIRQKAMLGEEIPEGMQPYQISGTIFLLGIS